MSEFLSKCEEYFQSRDFYEVLKLTRDANDKEIKKAYHKLSLLIHPDRVEETKKIEATEKFKVLGKIHSILQDPEKKKIYDESGEFDEEGDSNFNWLDYWRSMFKKISIDDIKNYEKEYIGSETELRDIKKAYIMAKGDMERILESVPFSNCDSEPRIVQIVQEMVDAGEVEAHDIFFKEPKGRKLKRRRMWENEKSESETVDIGELTKAIEKNHQKSEKRFINLLEDIELKYCSKSPKRRSLKSEKHCSPKQKRNSSKGSPVKKTRASHKK